MKIGSNAPETEPARAGERGFALAPVIVALSLGAIGVTVVFNVTSTMIRTQAEMSQSVETNTSLKRALRIVAGAASDTDTDGVDEMPLPDAGAPSLSLDGADASGVIPSSSGAPKTDGAGREIGMCVWDADGGDPSSQPVLALFVSGGNGSFDSGCGDYANPVGDDRAAWLAKGESESSSIYDSVDADTGGGCAAGESLTWGGSAWSCVSEVADGALTIDATARWNGAELAPGSMVDDGAGHVGIAAPYDTNRALKVGGKGRFTDNVRVNGRVDVSAMNLHDDGTNDARAGFVRNGVGFEAQYSYRFDTNRFHFQNMDNSTGHNHTMVSLETDRVQLLTIDSSDGSGLSEVELTADRLSINGASLDAESLELGGVAYTIDCPSPSDGDALRVDTTGDRIYCAP